MTELDSTVTYSLAFTLDNDSDVSAREQREIWAGEVRDRLASLGLQPVFCADRGGSPIPMTGTTGGAEFGTFVMPDKRHTRPAFRPPPGAVLLDVDQKPGKKADGYATLCNAEIDLGLLPDTQRLTAHGFEQKSGRMPFRVPDGFTVSEGFFKQYGGAIDVIRTGHRFSMAPGDIHPVTGQPVVCYNPDGSAGELWVVDDWPLLPVDWLLALAGWEETHGCITDDCDDLDDDGGDALEKLLRWEQAAMMARNSLDAVRNHDTSGSGFRAVLLTASRTIGGLVGSIYPEQGDAARALAAAVKQAWKSDSLEADDKTMIRGGLEMGSAQPWIVLPEEMKTKTPGAEPVADEVSQELTGVTELDSPDHPARCARQIAAYLTDHGRNMLVAQDEWSKYMGTHYEHVQRYQIESLMFRLTEHSMYADAKGKTRSWSPNPTKVKALIGTFGSLHETSASLGDWVGRPADRPYAGTVLVPCRNGILDVESRVVLSHDPRWFLTHCLPADYDPDASCPNWTKLLEAQWGNRPMTMQALQEWFGYVLSGRTDLHKAVLMYGPRRSAKGTIARVLEKLMGHGSVGMKLGDLTSAFGLMHAVSAPLAVFGDVRWSGLTSGAQTVSRILEITGEDRVTIDRKYREPWTGQMPTRLMFVSNDEPTLPDTSGALASRFLTFATTTSFLGQEDTRLMDKLTAELAGILNWALEGYDRLMAAGAFTQPEGADEQLRRLAGAGSNVSGFLYACCDLSDPDARSERDEVYQAYRAWCIDQHIDARFIVDKPRFGQALNSAVTQPHDDRRVRINGKQVRVYTGVQLLPEEIPVPGADDFDDGYED